MHALKVRPLPGERIELPDGSAAERVHDCLELRDTEGRLVLRYGNGEAELIAPRGDFKLSAPEGAIVLEAASDIELCAQRDVVQRPQRRAVVAPEGGRRPAIIADRSQVVVDTPAVKVRAQKSELATGRATLLAQHLQTSAQTVSLKVERYELTAERLIERSRDTFREITDLLQERAGRVRRFVDDVHALYSDRTVMVSKKDTTIDGEKILLG